jgi:uncharacterized membrane protein YhaH (DUF805 family)
MLALLYSTSGEGADDSKALYVVIVIAVVLALPLLAMLVLRIRDHRSSTDTTDAPPDTSKPSIFSSLVFSRGLAGPDRPAKPISARSIAWLLVVAAAAFLIQQLL